jgi:hypothetical protein
MSKLECIIGERINYQSDDNEESYSQMYNFKYCGNKIIDLQKLVNYEENGVYFKINLKNNERLRKDINKLVNEVCNEYPDILSTMKFGCSTSGKVLNLHPDNFSKTKYYEKIKKPDAFYWHSNLFRLSYIPDECALTILTNHNISNQLKKFLGKNNKFTKEEKNRISEALEDILCYLD